MKQLKSPYFSYEKVRTSVDKEKKNTHLTPKKKKRK